MRRHLREAAKEVGDTLPTSNECLGVMIRRWEKDGGGGVSERYRIHYCRAFKIPLDQFGSAPAVHAFIASDAEAECPAAPPAAPAPPAPPAPSDVLPPAPPDVLPPAPSDVGRPGPMMALAVAAGDRPRDLDDAPPTESAGLSLAHEVTSTASRGREHARRAEGRDLGDASLEHLRSDVTRLSRDDMTAEPLPLFFEMRRVREQLYLALGCKLWPRDETELYFLLGCLTSLMSDAADSIGSPAAAEELARAGLAYSQAIDHHPLTARLRLSLAATALWSGHPRRCLDLARSGLSYHPAGPDAAQLHLMTARAAARPGDSQTATTHLSNAAQLMDAGYTDDLLQIGGQFTLTRVCYHYLAGSAAAELPGDQTDATSHLDQAIQLYTERQDTSEDQSEQYHMLARIDLAAVLLRAGILDAASTVIGPVLALPPSRRTARLPKRLARTRDALTAPRYRTDTQATALGQQIEQYSRDTIATRLHHTVRPS